MPPHESESFICTRVLLLLTLLHLQVSGSQNGPVQRKGDARAEKQRDFRQKLILRHEEAARTHAQRLAVTRKTS